MKALYSLDHYDKILEKRAKRRQQLSTIVVDGSDESGKTTFIKYLQIITENIEDFPKSEELAKQQLLEESISILDEMKRKQIYLLTANAEVAAQRLRNENPPLQAVEVLQADSNFRSFSVVIPNFQQLLEAVKYNFNEAEALLVHQKPREFEYLYFEEKSRQFEVLYTANGHEYLQNTDLLLYTVSLADYFIPTAFNLNMNKLLFSLHKFEIMINKNPFTATPVLVLLTNFDRLLEIYEYEPFSTYFLDCKSSEVESIVKYVETRFKAVNMNDKRNVYCYAVNLVDIDRMGRVLEEIQEILKEEKVRGVLG